MLESKFTPMRVPGSVCEGQQEIHPYWIDANNVLPESEQNRYWSLNRADQLSWGVGRQPLWVLTTKLAMTTVARKNGTQVLSLTRRQSHIDSIHSPHSTRNTIIILCIKSVKFHRGTFPFLNLNFFSVENRDVSDVHQISIYQNHGFIEVCG